MAKTVAVTAASLLFLLASSPAPLVESSNGRHEAAAPAVQGMFVFGSSLVDNGNNNFLRNSTARADYLPYGIDFPLGPSGRFSNGRNPVDALGELLGLPVLIPPFADPTTRGPAVVHGVDFASGGSGILDQTGQLVSGEVVSLRQQVSNFESVTLPDLKTQLGVAGDVQLLHQILAKYLFVVGTGGNDYLLNYFYPDNRHNKPSLLLFTEALVSDLSRQLQRLYALGARKFVVFSIQAMGCIPAVRAADAAGPATNGSCVEPLNQAALLFNSHLTALVRASKQQMPNSTVVFVNSYKIIKDIVDNPTDKGFNDTSRPCCEVSPKQEAGGGILCRRGGDTCTDRTSHVFFDGLHPTDAVNVRIAQKAYASNAAQEAFPINVKQLALLHVL